MWISEGEEDRERREIFEVIKAENFLKFMIDTNHRYQEAQRTPSKVNNPAPPPQIYTYSYHIQISKNQRQNKGKKTPYRNKVKNDIRLLFRNQASKERIEWNISSVKEYYFSIVLNFLDYFFYLKSCIVHCASGGL